MGKHEELGMDELGNAVFQIIDNGEILESKTPEQKGLWRSKEFCYIFTRTALDTLRMVNVSATFVQRVCYHVKNRDGFDYHYFYWEKGMSLPCVRILDSRMGTLCGLTFQVNVTDRDYVRKTAQPKRLTKEQVQKILKDKVFEGIPYLGIFGEDDGSEFCAPKQP